MTSRNPVTKHLEENMTNTTTLRHIAVVLVGVILCAGCASTRMGTDFTSANVSKLKIGETTEQDVIQLIGQPGNRTRNSDGTVILSYMFSPGETVTPFSGFDPHFVQRAGAGMKTLIVILDASGKVKSFTESRNQ
jgi:outer membrane protein assembly factor BamE (lipoprotein component of BamABCDE complex)